VTGDGRYKKVYANKKRAKKMKVNKKFIPCHDVVFSMMFEDSWLFKKLIKAVLHKDIELIDTPFSQITKREKVTVAAVRFDLFARTAHGIFSIDMQRSYGTELNNRILFYASRLISTQTVIDMNYADIQPVNVSFIMAEKPSGSKNSVRYVSANYQDTGEVFSDLLNIALVYVPTVVKTEDEFSDLRIFAEFFSIQNDKDWEIFEKHYKKTKLGVNLMKTYSNVSANEELLTALAKEQHYTEKDYERITKQRVERAVNFAVREERKLHLKSLSRILPITEIAKVYGMSQNEIEEILSNE
jgi:predicted transposase/invertase (TIGR01784 family)